MFIKTTSIAKYSLIIVAALVFILAGTDTVRSAEESGSVGIEGKISAPPPTQAATITFPGNGQTLNNNPITVTGLCPDNVTVRIYKNNVFAGAAQCVNGSYSIEIDLFPGRNELVARVFDDLDQAGPDSNKVVVVFSVGSSSAGDLVSLSSAFAKRGSNPGQTLNWPLVVTGGDGPYAITVDWGDGKEPDILTQESPGDFNVGHIYENPGIYTVVVRAADRNKNVAFLQVIGVSNGEVSQEAGAGTNSTEHTKILWQPALAIIPLLLVAFWLGKKHQIHDLRKRLEKS